MNAIVKLAANAAGFLSPTPAARTQAAIDVASLATANILGRLPSAVKSLVTKSSETSEGVDQELDRDAFLQLLVMEMQYQDPLNPVDNTDMIAQLAQFSSLEQMESLNDSFTELSGNVDQLNYISAAVLLGREIIGIDTNGETVEGVVQGIHMDGSIVYLAVDDHLVSMAGVIGILEEST